MKLNEKQEAQVKNYIKKLIKEELESMDAYDQFEGDYKKDYPHKGENEKKPLKNPDGTSDQNNEDEREQQLRSSVEKFFKSPNTVGRKIDIAGYAYQLDGIKPTDGEDSNEMKNSRSLFMKKLNHEPNDQGYPYSFSTAEINRLASIISSNNTISEAVGSAIKKVIKEANTQPDVKKNNMKGYPVGGFGHNKPKTQAEKDREKEEAEHRFDDKYWADKNKRGEEIEEIVRKSVNKALKEWLSRNK